MACSPPALRVGTSGDYPPFSVREESGTEHGFDMSVAHAYARDRGLALQVVPFRWPELEERLLDGQFDVAMGGITVRGDRLARAPMTTSVARADAIVLVRKGEATRDLDRVGVVVAVNRGGHLEKLARARFRHATIQTVDDNQGLRDLLAGRRVHAVVTDSIEARTFAVDDEWNEAYEVYEVLARDRKAYWVSPKRFDLVLDMNQWIGARAADRWLETERIVWMDDPQRPSLPVDEATLVDHLAQRLLLMPLVAEAKRANGLPIDAPDREERIEESARREAVRIGLEPTAYLRLVRAEMEAAKSVQRAVLASDPSVDSATLPDLGDDVRPAIDRIDTAIRITLVWAAPVVSSVDDIVEALRFDAPVPGLDEESLRAIARAARSIPAVSASRS